jgi:hypothetical protein
MRMKRICNKAKSFKEAEEWDIEQYLRMTPEERQAAAKELRERVYGQRATDVKESMRQR